MFDFDRSGETASLAEGLIIESENGRVRVRVRVKPVHVNSLFLFLCLNVYNYLGFL